MNLDHVAFRACELAVKPEWLDPFREFFGATSVGAPRKLDSCGRAAPVVAPDFEAWVTLQKQAKFKYWIDKNVAFAFKLDPVVNANSVRNRE